MTRGVPARAGSRAPVPSLEADVRRVAGRPRVPAVDVDASRAGRAAGGHDLELAQQVVPGAAIQVLFAQASGEARVGHHRVEVVHQIGLGHHRQIDDGTSRQRGDVEPSSRLPMPRRPFHRRIEQGSKCDRTLLFEARRANRCGRRSREPTARRPPHGRLGATASGRASFPDHPPARLSSSPHSSIPHQHHRNRAAPRQP